MEEKTCYWSSKFCRFITHNPKVNSDYIINFLQRLEQEPVEKIYLICDKASYNESKKVKEFIAKFKIELVFLLPYSLN